MPCLVPQTKELTMKRRSMLSLAMAASLLFAACGSDDDTATEETEETTTTTVEETPEETAAAEEGDDMEEVRRMFVETNSYLLFVTITVSSKIGSKEGV